MLGYAHCALRLSRLLEAVADEPCILPISYVLWLSQELQGVLSSILFTLQIRKLLTISNLTSLDKGWDSFDNY